MQWYVAAYYSFYTVLIGCRVCVVGLLAGQINNNQSEDHFRQLEISDSQRQVEAYFNEIQEIPRKRFPSYFRAFDYGDIRVETAASHVSIDFQDAPDPEGIRRFIYHVKPQ